MESIKLTRRAALALVCTAVPALTGCHHWQKVRAMYQRPSTPPTLGYIIDDVTQAQEGNAERSDFVIYQHEFTLHTDELNDAGMSHVQQIAARLPQHHDFLVLVERSLTSERAGTEFHYLVNPNPKLDMQRREVIVRSLIAMGIADADERVIVSYSLTPGQKAIEAERDYQQQLGGGFGYGGGFGGGGGFGSSGFGGGGFGGGGFF